MQRNALAMYACPKCEGSSRLVTISRRNPEKGEVEEGQLQCEGCRSLVPFLRRGGDIVIDVVQQHEGIPAVGRTLGDLIPIGLVSHKSRLDYTDEELKRVKIMSAFDMLAPRYDQPQEMEDARGWFHEAGLVGIEMKYGYNGINARGRRPS